MNHDLPDLSGRWGLLGKALGSDGETLYEWEAAMDLAPTADAFAVAVETRGIKTSRSISFAERLTALPLGEWHLRYGFEADETHFATADHRFFGLTQLTFAPDLASAVGSSCNYNGRYMIMDLKASRA